MKKLALAAAVAALTGGAAAFAAPANPTFFVAYFNALASLSDGATPAQLAALAKAEGYFETKKGEDLSSLSADVGAAIKADKLVTKTFPGNAEFDTAADSAAIALFNAAGFQATAALAAYPNNLSKVKVITKMARLLDKCSIDGNATAGEQSDVDTNRVKFLGRVNAVAKYSGAILRRHGS